VITGLSQKTSSRVLKDVFAHYGSIASVTSPADSGNRAYTGAVTFVGPDGVSAAQRSSSALSGSVIGENQVHVAIDDRIPTKVHISGLTREVTWQTLRETFGKYGPVGFAAVGPQQYLDPGRGEVRFQGPDGTEAAKKSLDLDGKSIPEFGGNVIQVKLDPNVPDGMEQTRILVSGIPPGATYMTLKHIFAPYGDIAFAVCAPGLRADTARISPS